MSRNAKILLVDDEPHGRQALGRVLGSAGYGVCQAERGEEALASLANGVPDLILLDIRMPGMDGFEVFRRIKANENWSGIPIIMLSGIAEAKERAAGIAMGASDFITKPFDSGELLARVRLQLEMDRLRAGQVRHAAELQAANEQLREEIARGGQREQELKRIEWMVTREDEPDEGLRDRYVPPYGDLLSLNTSRLILDAVGRETLTGIVSDYLDLLETSAAVYEMNGDYALGIFSSGWCRFMDAASRDLCGTADNREALACGQWRCHESCWSGASTAAIATGHPVDIGCSGGLRLYAIPIRVGGEIVGAINFGYGDPPRDEATLRELAAKYHVGIDELRARAEDYESRPTFIIGLAKRRLEVSASLIGEIVERRQTEKALRESERDYRLLFEGMLEGFALHEILCDESGKPVDYRFLSINPAFEKIIGIRAADAVGKTVRELLPETEASWIQRYGRVALTGEPTQFEKYSASLGKHFHITAYRPQPGQFAVVCEDITARKAADARIARLTQLYAALSQCNQAIVHSTSVEGLLPEICRVAVEFGGMKMAWIGMLDEATGEIRQAAAFGCGTDYLKEIRFSTDLGEPSGRAPMSTAVRENTPVWCQDFQNDPRTTAWAKRGAAFGWAAVAALPLRIDGRTVGGIATYSGQVGAFDEEGRKLLEEMAHDISFALGSFRHNEERKRAEELLESSREILQAAMDNSPAGIAIADAPDGQLRYVNKAGLLIAGMSEEATRGIDFNQYASSWHLTDLDDRPLHAEEVPLARALLFGEICTRKFKIHRPDNESRIVLANAAPIFDCGGKVKAGIVVFLDITGSEQAAESVRMMSEMLDAAPCSITVHNAEGRFFYANRMTFLWHGFTADEFLSLSLTELDDPDSRALFHERIRLVEEHGEASFEVVHYRKDGTTFPLQVHAKKVVWAGKPAILGILADITERKRDEAVLHAANRHLEEAVEVARNLALKAEAAALAKSEFFAIISHELRTPLNSVLGFGEILAETPLNDEQKSFVQTISSSGNHLLSIVNDILDFSSIEKGALAIRSEPFATDALLNSAVIGASKDASAKGLEFRCEKEPGVPDQLVGDERRIRQVLLNLLNNAVKFTADGSVVLRVSPAYAGDRPFLNFSVEDTGIGISPGTIDQLFQPFVQADSTMQRKFGGTGLGLVISKRIAEAMGGSLVVVSAPGQGSTFTFRLPLKSAPEKSVSRILPLCPAEPGSGPTLHPECSPVLVVDDDGNSRNLVARMLKNLGHRAEFAADGAEALRAFAPEKFSAILMDVAMPVMDGLEAARKIREVEAVSGDHVPIIALTANVMPGDRERCLAAGMDEFLSKPFQKEQLGTLLDSITKGS